MQFLTRDALVQKMAEGGALAGVRLQSRRVEWERALPSDEDRERVRAALGDDAAGARLVKFTISGESRASDGHVLKQAGCLLDAYERNPRVLWQHNRWRPRIGDSVAWVEGDKLRAIAAFLGRDLSDALDGGFSWALGELAARRGHAASIGFEILGATPAPEAVRKELPWALDVHSWRLLEWSLVNIGADVDAVDDGRAAGLDTAPLAAAFARMLDEGALRGIVREEMERLWAAAAPERARVVVVNGGGESQFVTKDQVHAAAAAAEQGKPPAPPRAADAGLATEEGAPPGPRAAAADLSAADFRAAVRAGLGVGGAA